MRKPARQALSPRFLKHRKTPWGGAAAIASIGSCLVVSLFYWDKDGPLSSMLAASSRAIFQKQEYWRLFTAIFAHGDLEHYLSNMMMLGFLVYFVASFYGLRILAGGFMLGGAAVNLATVAYLGGDTRLVGASGVVYLLWGFWLSLFIRIQKNFTLPGRLLRAGAIFLVMLIPTTYSPSTSYFAHYFGFGLGALAGILYYSLSPQKPTRDEIEEDIRKDKPSGHPEPWEEDMEWASGRDEE